MENNMEVQSNVVIKILQDKLDEMTRKDIMQQAIITTLQMENQRLNMELEKCTSTEEPSQE